MTDLKQRGFYQGINLGGWFSQCDYIPEKMDDFITEQDFQKISAWGFDHVRIPVDYNLFLLEDGLARLDKAVSLCRTYDLHTVLDLHKTAGFSFDNYGENEHGFFENPVYQEQFYQLWEKLAVRYGKLSEQIAFELLNEVTDRSYLPAWLQIYETCIRRIRKFAPDTLIFIGSAENNSARTVQYLNPPHDDKIIYNMHCYEPLFFTHQGAYWTEAIHPDEKYQFAESNITEEYFEQLFSSAIEKAKKNQTVLYCGEYGVIDQVSPEDTLNWFRTIHHVFEKYHIAHCIWNYRKLDFGFSDTRLDSIREELLKSL